MDIEKIDYVKFYQEQYKFQGETELKNVKFNCENTPLFIDYLFSLTDTKPNKSQLEKLFSYYPLLKNIGVSQSARSVCAKVVKRGQTIVECIDCRMDQSCIICLDCFKNGEHVGHKILYKKAYGGCCDCGDSQAWKPEGFCKLHSGQIQDIPIDKKEVQKFIKIFQDLFYIYYKLKLQKKNKYLNNYIFIILVKTCQNIVEQGPKGIKLLSLFFNSKLPNNLAFNILLQNQSIIKQMFYWKFIKTDFQFWENVFIKMFPYYEFKKKLLQTYIECFPMFYTCQQASNYGQSIAGQILTSYKLVEDYADNKNSKPFMFNAQSVQDKQRLITLTKIIYNDLQKIHRLQSTAPIKFIKLQLTQGFDAIFAFHHLFVQQIRRNAKVIDKLSIKQKLKKKKAQQMVNKGDTQDNENQSQILFRPILTMVKNINNCEIEFITLTMLRKMLRVVKGQKALLISILRQLVGFIENQADVMKDLSIFRSFDRAFCLTLFTLCDERLELLLDPDFKKFLQEGLQKNPEQYAKLISDLQKRMLQTYFFSTHVSCNQNKGYNSSFFTYLYFYRGKDRLLLSIDIVQLKMLALLNNSLQTFQFAKIMRFQDFQEQKWTLHIFNTFYQSYRLLFISQFAQIYLTHYEIQQKKVELSPKTIKAIAKFIVGQGNSVTLDKVNKFATTFLFDNIQLLKKYLLNCCNYSKEKRIFELLQQFRHLRPYNLQDFEGIIQQQTLNNRIPEQKDPQNTLQLIGGYNKKVCQHYLSDSNAQRLKQSIIGLNTTFGEQESDQILTTYGKLICQFATELKFVEPEPLISKQLLIRIQIKPQIKKKLQQYRDLIGEDTFSSQDVQNKAKEKKELLRLKKLKKLNEIKKKNQDNITAIKSVHNLQQKQSAQSEEFCAICRKIDMNRSGLVFICSLTIRNLDKLFGKGDGVQTISFTSCYHLFHSDCLAKQLKMNANTTILRCPTCRKAGNIFLPAYPLENEQANKVFIEAFMQKVTHIMMTINSYKQIDSYQQLMKSFYLYVQLFMYDTQYMKSRRVRLYRIILQLLSHPCLYQRAYDFFIKFSKNQINLLPKLLKKKRVVISHLLQRVYNGMEIYDIADDIQEDEAQQIQNQIQVRQRFVSGAVNILKLNKKSSTTKYEEEMPVQMKYSFIKILANIFQRQVKYYQNEKSKIQQAIIQLRDGLTPQVSSIVQLALLELIQPLHHNINIEEAVKTFEFIKMPSYFDWDMSKNYCDLCHETCESVYICLLCNWKGCMDCKSGGVNEHYQSKHGQQCAFLQLNNATVFIVQSKILYKIGCIYFNEWGEQFKIKKDWKSFELDESKLQKAKEKLLREE